MWQSLSWFKYTPWSVCLAVCLIFFLLWFLILTCAMKIYYFRCGFSSSTHFSSPDLLRASVKRDFLDNTPTHHSPHPHPPLMNVQRPGKAIRSQRWLMGIGGGASSAAASFERQINTRAAVQVERGWWGTLVPTTMEDVLSAAVERKIVFTCQKSLNPGRHTITLYFSTSVVFLFICYHFLSRLLLRPLCQHMIRGMRDEEEGRTNP